MKEPNEERVEGQNEANEDKEERKGTETKEI